MIRKRIPRQDDTTIYRLIEELLVPYARQTKPGLLLTPALIRKRLAGGITYVDTAAGRKPAGFILLKPKERERLRVDLLAVHRSYQGHGIGRRLMEKAERTAAMHGCREVELWVDEANVNAQRFYHRLGYGAVYYDVRLRCYLMVKPLA
ncbi:GNAT family N-acetyltransferase [Paenibacillus mucilaginosus]|uniref:GCN5-related N-acetyltransferase n=1 Tax=Paenibacillus mucilaginosus (strain KNP414) TaxID=1036673 RepID=F8FBC4_PAEMK|nr:GNAT family N-acetyltransferase [Paenibacillus mucilaginosus]AEI42091.1 GCN5-related N-acetyltransferase [Paenibacillus mucilaginosus KNP414]MCG7214077.1 GNAT family N-acetyltransferase [Paenibacillus mucilaginosus]WDM28600.1 GNAT family N-acetyltransferase [Paenibacillus mucilaginosus]